MLQQGSGGRRVIAEHQRTSSEPTPQRQAKVKRLLGRLTESENDLSDGGARCRLRSRLGELMNDADEDEVEEELESIGRALLPLPEQPTALNVLAHHGRLKEIVKASHGWCGEGRRVSAWSVKLQRLSNQQTDYDRPQSHTLRCCSYRP